MPYKDQSKNNAISKKWAADNPERIRFLRERWVRNNPNYTRDKQLENRYGLTRVEYNNMLARQGGRCAMPDCRTDNPRGKGVFEVDHDHETGEVRGLLCSACNVRLGTFEKRKEVFASYIARSKHADTSRTDRPPTA